MTDIELTYLRAIDSHSGEWTWYQLDRFLSGKNVRLVDDLPAVISGLEKSGHISFERRENLDYYLITEKGRQALASTTT